MRYRVSAFLCTLTALSVLAAGCGATDADDSGSGGDLTGLRIMVPNTPGGGYDTTARIAAAVLEEADISPSPQVFNLPGAGGTVGLQRTINQNGDGQLLMQMGLGVVGASYTSESKATLEQTTPIARTIEEAGAIVVSKDSPYQTIEELVEAWRKSPGNVTVGGGSSPGGPDHLLPMQLAEAVGIEPKKVSYVAYDGGGELLPALLGEKVSFGASGFGEFLDQVEAGQLRVLAVTSPEPVDVLDDVPTLKESGIDLVFLNWRGFVAPPGISAADRRTLLDAVTRMRDSREWKDELDKRGWTDSFLAGEKFGDYMAAQDREVASILAELGLA